MSQSTSLLYDSRFRPMLAATPTEGQLREILAKGSLFGSPKLDGIRAITRGGAVLSRTLKHIPNKHVQKLLGGSPFEGLDGELICGDPYGKGVFARASSAFMSSAGDPKFTYYVFDLVRPHSTFSERQKLLWAAKGILEASGFIQVLPQVQLDNFQALEDYESWCLYHQYEGVILRHPEGPYKAGRSTMREAGMIKLKRWADREAEILDVGPLMRNENEAFKNELGLQVRSSHKAGKVEQETLGRVFVRDLELPNWEFWVGSGFDQELRDRLWARKETLIGKVIKYKFLPVGTLEAPRHPIFLGFRDVAIDLVV